MSTFGMTQGDRSPAIEMRLLDGKGQPVNLTGATVDFVVWARDGTLLIDAAATVVGDPLDGYVRYEWQAGDTDRPGAHKAQWRVTYADTAPEHFPLGDPIQLPISAKPPAV